MIHIHIIDFKSMSYYDVFASYKDPLFCLLTKLIGEMTSYNFTAFLLIIGILFMAPIGYFIYKYSPYPLLSIVLLLSLGFYDAQMVIIRQSAAIAISSFVYIFLKDKKYVLAIIAVLIATCFHLTAILLLFVGFIALKKIDKKMIAIYLLTIIVVAIFSNTISEYLKAYMTISDRLAGYSEADSTLSMSGFVQLVLISLYVFMNYKGTIRKYPDAIISINMLVIALLFQSLVIVSAEFFRVAWYFKYFLILLLPQVVKATGNKNSKSIVYLLFIVYYLYSIRGLDYAFFWEKYIPSFNPW